MEATGKTKYINLDFVTKSAAMFESFWNEADELLAIRGVVVFLIQ